MDNKRTDEEKISASRLISLLAEINEKLDRLESMDNKIDSMQDDIKYALHEFETINVKINILENRIIKGDSKEDIKLGFDEIKYHIDSAQLKIRNSVKLVSDKVTNILENE
ncbi:hypothetical protein QJR30_07705 [Paraclostridium sordellii]|uniref:hypothetical protein n=1 Tax=Paraclostridium sordellii TaxID=1505 RepID=UPI001C8CEF64|nr:hypothetical protein [Paeniclostridium sordellii]MBX9179386.1 hypothetical protein [Paeniclostridium sordellii]MCR1848242.1 hypothetical protein [Paeniclostridium sordellii]